MFEVAADDRPHPDPVAESGDPRLEAALASDDQVDVDTGLRCLVELLGHSHIDQTVHLENHPASPGGDFVVDERLETGPQLIRRDQQLAVADLASVPGEMVEQVGDIGADLRVGGEDADVFVDPGGAVVVVARADMAVAADAVGFLANGHRNLGVDFQTEQAIGDMDPRLFEPTGPPNVRGLVESGLEFDEHGDLLALFGRLDAGIDDRAAAGGAVERDLDGQHVGVVRGLVDELNDRAAERLVRVLNENITSSDLGEDVDRFVAGLQSWVDNALPLGPTQSRAFDVGDLVERGRIERRSSDVDRRRVEIEFAEQEVEHLVGHRCIDLEAGGTSEPAPPQFVLDRRQEVVGLVERIGKVGIAGDAEGVVLLHLHARKQLVEMCGDDFLERHETIGVADPEPSGQRVRDLHPGEEFALVPWIADDDRQVERQIRHIGERVTRVDSERRKHREDPVAEPLRQPSLVVGVEIAPRRQLDSLLAKGRHDFVDENSLLLGHQVGDDVAHECKLLGRKPPIGSRSGDACCLLIPKARDAHLKELVEVAGEDGEESNLLEQRHLGVARELEDPGVEGEPTQLPVEDVGVVVIPAPDLGHHIGAEDGRRAGHARSSTNSAAPIAPPASPRRARTTGAVMPANARSATSASTRSRNGSPSRSAKPPPSTTSSMSRMVMTDAMAVASADAAWSTRRRASGSFISIAVAQAFDLRRPSVRSASIASLSGAPAASTRRSSALRPA